MLDFLIFSVSHQNLPAVFFFDILLYMNSTTKGVFSGWVSGQVIEMDDR